MSTNYYIHEIPADQKQKIATINQIKSLCLSRVDSLFTVESIFNANFNADFVKDLHINLTILLEDFFKCEQKSIQGDYEIHIGKSIGGYRFIFSDYKTSYNEWISYITQSDGKIYDEYNQLISAKELLEIISLSEANRIQSVGNFYYKDDKTMFDVLSGYWC